MMYTCPEKDIHSIYVDNELPAAYCGDYEAHIKSCPKCAAELKRMQAVHEELREDAAAHTPDCHFMEDSFNRLQARMKYSNVTSDSRKIFTFSTIKWSVPAAAAVFALLFIPLSMRNTSPSEKMAMQTITRAALKPIAKKGVIVDGNISHTSLASLFKNEKTKTSVKAHDAEYAYSSQSAGAAIAGASTVSSSSHSDSFLNSAVNTPLSDVDVFRPDFENKAVSVSIKITFPEMSNIPIETEALPASLYSKGSNR